MVGDIHAAAQVESTKEAACSSPYQVVHPGRSLPPLQQQLVPADKLLVEADRRGASPGSDYSAHSARKVVLAAESSSNVQAGRDFGVDKKNVRRWRGQREKLFACAATRMAFTGPRKGRHPEMETALADFVRMQRAAALPVTTEVLQTTARALSR
ncbi:hypothetical protein HPB52_002778 [Rhipicephalus sanguineus]|uniref:Brinker DNA-binding domain-containing protein n=1 Tax=Rhipicephalus sanguineus TaxID=34632 RepID=A0A9D4T8D3_RHISA|nr:hypothetical protein HPB52_002778 [Rhipicephalus sanguineus]